MTTNSAGPSKATSVGSFLFGLLIGLATITAVGAGIGYYNWQTSGKESDTVLASVFDTNNQAKNVKPRTATVTVSGDLLWHTTVYGAAMTADGGWDFASIFAPMEPILQKADLAICHEEVPFGPPEGPFSGYPTFSAPPQVAQGVREVGFDACTTASNHSVDGRFDGIQRTLTALDEAGLPHVGMARSPEEAEDPVILTTKQGVKIAIVTGTYGTNGIPVPEPWMVPDLDPQRLLDQAHHSREAGADIVMVAIHAGEEGMNEPNQQQRELADILTKSHDVDLVYGHHAHAVQPITKVNGKWVIYGLGNMIAQQESFNLLAYDGLTVKLTFTENTGNSSSEASGAPDTETTTSSESTTSSMTNEADNERARGTEPENATEPEPATGTTPDTEGSWIAPLPGGPEILKAQLPSKQDSKDAPEEAPGTSRFTVGRVEYIPTLITPPGYLPVQVAPISSLDTSDPRVAQSLQRTRSTVLLYGADKYPELAEG